MYLQMNTQGTQTKIESSDGRTIPRLPIAQKVPKVVEPQNQQRE